MTERPSSITGRSETGASGKESAFRGFFVSTLGFDLVSRGLSALSLVLFIRSLSTPAFAYVVLLQAVAQFVGSPLTGGIRTRYMREEAERVSRGISAPSSFVHPVVLELVVIAGVALVAWVVADALGLGESSEQRAVFVASAAVMGVGHALIELVMQHHQARLGFVRAGLIVVARGLALFIVGLLSHASLVTDPLAVGAWMAGLLFAVGALVAVPVMLASWGSRAGVEGRFGFGHESAWLTIYYVISGGYAYMGMFLAAALLSAHELAGFGAATRYISIVAGPIPALLAVLRVRTAQHDIVDSSKLQAGMLVGWARKSALPTVAFVLFAAIVANVAIPLLDNGKHPESIPVFQLMLIGIAFGYVTMPSSNLLLTQRRFRLLARLYAAMLVLLCALSVPAGLAFGGVGIAAAGSFAVGVEGVSMMLAALAYARRSEASAIPQSPATSST